MLRRTLVVLSITVASVISASAQTQEEQTFIDYQTALAIDDKCHFFRHFERQRSRDVNEELVALLPISTMSRESNEFWIEYRKYADQGRAKAASISCTDNEAAAPYILTLRDRFAHYLYADLLIASESKRMSEEQLQAAQAYETMIRPLYGENWEGFVAHASTRAQFEIDQANSQDISSSPYTGLYEDLFGDAELDDLFGDSADDIGQSSIYLDALISGTLETADTIVFEMIAETAGYRVWTLVNNEGSGQVVRLVDGSGTGQFDLWQLPEGYVTLEKAGPIKLAFAIAQDGTARVMSFGEHARRIKDGSMTILVHPGELPANLNSDYAYMRSQEWLDGANIYKAEPVEEPCLGGPCFALPPDVIDDILSGSFGQAFRFFIAIEAEPPMPPLDSQQVHTGFPYSLNARQTFVAAEAQ